MQPADLTGVVLDGRYRILEPVAQGAMGVVYRAERVKLGRIVAVKVMHEVLPSELSSRRRFEVEAMAMAKLEHPHCAAVVDVGLHGDRPFVVMDFVSGQDLKDVIAAEAPLPVGRAVEILRQILSGLAHAHELGIIHRDIKPANLVLSQKAGLGDHVKVLDFGLARLSQDSSLTTGMVVGTPSYMAPEQIRGQAIDGRVDLYACGIILFEMLTGQKPFVSVKDDPIEVCTLHLKQPVPRLADVRPDLGLEEMEGVVARALAKVADERFGSAVEFAAALDALVPRRGLVTPPAGTPALDAGGTLEYAGAAAPVRVATPPAGVRTLPMPALATEPTAVATPVTAGPASTSGSGAGVTATPTPVDAATVSGSGGSVPGAVSGALTPGPTLPDASSRSATASGPAVAAPRRDRRRIAVMAGAGALVLIVIVIALAAGGGGTTATPDAAVAAAASEAVPPGPDPADESVARVNELVASGQKGAAIDLAAAARKIYPDDARLPYLLGKLYFERLYLTDGLKMFREAIRLQPAYRTDPELIKAVLRGFITTPRADAALADFLRQDVGDEAKPYLEETAAQHPNQVIRARAAAELRRYR